MAVGARAPTGTSATQEGVAGLRNAARHLSRPLPADIAVAPHVASGAPIPRPSCVRDTVARRRASDGVATCPEPVRGAAAILGTKGAGRSRVVAAYAPG